MKKQLIILLLWCSSGIVLAQRDGCIHLVKEMYDSISMQSAIPKNGKIHFAYDVISQYYEDSVLVSKNDHIEIKASEHHVYTSSNEYTLIQGDDLLITIHPKSKRIFLTSPSSHSVTKQAISQTNELLQQKLIEEAVVLSCHELMNKKWGKYTQVVISPSIAIQKVKKILKISYAFDPVDKTLHQIVFDFDENSQLHQYKMEVITLNAAYQGQVLPCSTGSVTSCILDDNKKPLTKYKDYYLIDKR